MEDNKKINSIRTSRITKKVRKINRDKNYLWYKVSLVLTILIFSFIILTNILQIEWLKTDESPMPIFAWLIMHQWVGIFFIPFIFLLLSICVFILQIAKPVTHQSVLNDCSTLVEFEEMEKKHYDIIANEINISFDELKRKQEKLLQQKIEIQKKNEEFIKNELEKLKGGDSKN